MRNKLFLGCGKAIASSVAVLAISIGITSRLNAMPLDKVTPGLFYPTSSQRFLEQGQQKLETEIAILLKKQHLSWQNILKVRDDLPKLQEQLQPEEQLEPEDLLQQKND